MGDNYLVVGNKYLRAIHVGQRKQCQAAPYSALALASVTARQLDQVIPNALRYCRVEGMVIQALPNGDSVDGSKKHHARLYFPDYSQLLMHDSRRYFYALGKLAKGLSGTVPKKLG
jgi:hypothetical protein